MFGLEDIRRMNDGRPGRVSNAEILRGVDYLPGTAKRIANNTIRFETLDTDKTLLQVFRHRGTDVVTYAPATGHYILNSGGWQTLTTKDRINRFSPARLYQSKHEWFIDDRAGKPVEFEDGMTVDNEGYPL